jgi:hypothetical protein
MAAACDSAAAGGEKGGSREEVLAFANAAAVGDVGRQMQLLAAREDANPYGARVLRELHRPVEMRYFQVRSAQLSGVRSDTAWWMVQGIAPDRSQVPRWEFVDGIEMPRTSEATETELLLLPRIRTERMIVLVRGKDGWKLPLSSAHVGPLLMGLDSLDARCPYGKDPRPCRDLAERIGRMLAALPPGPRERWSYLAPQASQRVQAARAMDSLRAEVVNVRSSPYLLQTGVEVVVVNRSAVALDAVNFRILDAEGSVLYEHGSVSRLPARGRKETYVTIEARSFPRPIRVELVTAYPDDDD